MYPVLAVTATATPKVVDDIQEKLQFSAKNVFSKSFERKNLVYLVRQVEDKPKHLLKIINSIKGTGIVYVRNRLKTKETAQFLQQNGISADYYHAGLTPAQRDEKQNQWKTGKTRVIVSTNAFGMGIGQTECAFCSAYCTCPIRSSLFSGGWPRRDAMRNKRLPFYCPIHLTSKNCNNAPKAVFRPLKISGGFTKLWEVTSSWPLAPEKACRSILIWLILYAFTDLT
jgi:hypothetical protein